MTLVLVTGARGAIGRHIVAKAKSRGARVAGVGHGAWTSDPELPNIDLWINGAVDGDNLTSILREAGAPDIIVHLAGGSLVGPSIAHPGEDFRRTVDSSNMLLEWIRAFAPTTRLVVASSAAVYGEGHDERIPEDAPFNPTSPYGAHKAIMEMLCRSRARQYGLRIAIVRLFSVYGPGLRKQLVWDLTNRLIRGETRLVVGGSGNEMRDFVAIGDAAAMLLDAAERVDASAPVFNGCSGRAASVAEVTSLIARTFPGASFNFSGASRAGDPQYLVGDPTKARAAGLAGGVTLEAGISQTVEWIRRALATA